jgi:hypothetical protein
VSIAALFHRWRDYWQSAWGAARIPDGLRHRFDEAAEEGTRVQKTTRRQVVSLELSAFQAVDVVRTTSDRQVRHSPRLAALVPKGGKYGFDLIAHVGTRVFLQGTALQAVAAELRPRAVPFSSLHDLLMKFLYYFGHLHQQYAAPLLRRWFQQRGGMTWLMDATVEPGTPAYFGLLEAESRVCLGAWKIATENADDLVPCLRQATLWFGAPHEVLHDLGDAMACACDTAWGETVPHRVCHFHLLRDMGEDLYARPEAALRELVRKLKLQTRLKEQRHVQTRWLREHVEDTTALVQLLREQAADVSTDVLGREVALAFHQWILDYASDGRRQGYPFDPYLLYLHRRAARASAELERLLAGPAARLRPSRVLDSLSRMLRDYLHDARVAAAAAEFEQAAELFTRLRTAMRLSNEGTSPLHDPYLLESGEAREVQQSLEALREECREKAKDPTDSQAATACRIVVEHLDRYATVLFRSDSRQRTTNSLEGHWGKAKRCCRKRHGRKKLTRDFQCLPPDVMLIPNLENPQYVEQVLGDLSRLPAKLAEAARSAPPWTRWRSQQKPVPTGRLPQRLLRQHNLIDKLVATYDNHCQPESKRAA